MDESEITGIVIDAGMEIHKSLGPGLLESAYQRILQDELLSRGLKVRSEVALPVRFKERTYEAAFRADLVIQEKVIVELKSVEKLSPVHKKQLLTYLKLANMRVGLLMNFGESLLKDGIVRLVNKY